jgi:hypothetical protein
MNGKPSSPVLRGLGVSNGARLLNSYPLYPFLGLSGTMLLGSSRGPLAAVLPLFTRRIQLPIPLGENLLLMPAEHVPRRDVSDRTVQTDVVVMV